MRVAVTGGIACGKSLFAKYLNMNGVETLDADHVVHELIPDEERKRIAKEIFQDEVKRKALEARIHPLVKARIDDFLANAKSGSLRIAIIPILFEVNWNDNFDIICCISSTRENQIARMIEKRGYSKEEALSRLAAQWPVEKKAELADYVIRNDTTPEELEKETRKFLLWLTNLMYSHNQ